MKRHISFLLVTARGSTGRVLLLLMAMIAVEAALAYRALGLLARGQFTDLSGWAETSPFAAGRFELMEAARASGMSTVFLLSGLLLCVILSTNFTSRRQGGHVGYTLHRLSLSSRMLLGWNTLYNLLCFTILWGVQVILSLAFCHMALPLLDPTLANQQTLFTLFYHDTFLHNLLPLADVWRLVRNVLLILVFSLATSHASHCTRYQGCAWLLLCSQLLGFWAFHSELEVPALFLSLFLVLLIISYLILIWKEPTHELVDGPAVPAGE